MKKHVFWIILKIFSGAFLAIGLILWVCLLREISLWGKIIAGLMIGILLIFGLVASTRGSAILYNYRFGIFIGAILGLLVGLIFNFTSGVVFGSIFCLLFSVKDLVHKVSESASGLFSEIKYLWEQIKESIF